MPRRLALTGTPATGKTTLAAELARRGWRRVDLAAYAKERGLVVGDDAARGSLVLDEDALARALAAEPWDERPCVLDSHLSHLMPVEWTVVLRVDPLVLVERLRARGYGEAKIRENAEAEALGVVAEECEPPVLEIDATRATVADLADRVERAVLEGPFPSRSRVGWNAGSLPWI